MHAPLDRCLLIIGLGLTGQERDFFANQWGKGKAKKKKRSSRNKHYSFTVGCLAAFR
jgi:hypothetical protein